MRLKAARVKSYRSIRDSELVEIESGKTILVGPNEAGKTVFLQALQQINPPQGTQGFDALRDYPRSEYNDITTGRIAPKDVTVVEAHFALHDEDRTLLPTEFQNCTYVSGRRLDNTTWHKLDNAPALIKFKDIQKDLIRLAAHADTRVPPPQEGTAAPATCGARLDGATSGFNDDTQISGDAATKIKNWLKETLAHVDENNSAEVGRYEKLEGLAGQTDARDKVLQILGGRIPVFVLFSNYFRVKPIIHLEHLAQRIEGNILDDVYYDYGNKCLLQLLGFTARELSNFGKAAEPPRGDVAALKIYRDQLDKRSYQLNSASVRLTDHIRQVWVPDQKRSEADRLRVVADQQYLKVVVEDELGVEIELDQRSEGFQWLVSFFVVFFAEAADKHKNAILLLDEPGLSLHGLKQREFRTTISRLAANNQTLYTTHSPFLVGPDELDIVRVVEMTDRKVGTKVHTKITANDPAALLPLQEALGYDLAQSLFAQQRNLVLEGLTDYWYVEACSQLLADSKVAQLNERIALVPAGDAGKVVYYATILHAQKLKVAALLDSDAAGDQSAKQEVLVNTLGNKAILRTKDAYSGAVKKPEIEDLLRTTLVEIVKSAFGADVSAQAGSQPERPIADIFAASLADFSKYRLAKAFVRWSRDHTAADLTADEQQQWSKLIQLINAALK
jgi:energy-coupling factor transporter ATP-binding protein EcfA2